MNNQMVIIFNLKTRTGVIVPLKTIKITAMKMKHWYIFCVSDAIDIWDNRINLEERRHKLKRYCIIYRMGDDKIGEIIENVLKKYDILLKRN